MVFLGDSGWGLLVGPHPTVGVLLSVDGWDVDPGVLLVLRLGAIEEPGRQANFLLACRASEERSIETFRMDPLEGEPPRRIRVEFLRRIRDERRFDNPDALRAQIMKDVRFAQAWFRRERAWVGRAATRSTR